MNENMPTNVQLDANANGTVSFATEVVATIAGLAATEIEGVAGMAGTNTSTSLADILTRRVSNATKNLTKGVKVEVIDGKVKVDVNFVVEYGSPVPEVAKNIQENVKKAIETMSGLTVEVIDVHVQGISFERENKAVAEIEQQQRLLLQKQENERKAEEEAAAPAEKPQPVNEEPAQPEEAEAADDEAPSAEENEDEAEQE